MLPKVDLSYRDNVDSYRQWENQLSEDHKQALESFKRREKESERAANIKLLKAIAGVVLKVVVISLLAWAFLAAWQERLPK